VVKTLQNLDSQGLIWKIFRNKDLEGKIRPKSGVAAAGISHLWPHIDVKERFFAKGFDGGGPFAYELLLSCYD
jgi:hypothetical protein